MQTTYKSKLRAISVFTFHLTNVALIASYILFLSITTLAATTDNKQEIRTWTSAKGDKIQAKFINIKSGNVTLKAENGKFMKIKLSNLSTADQTIIKKLSPHTATPAEDTTGTGAITTASPTQLATFSDGKWKKYNTVFTSPKYDAAMDQDMNITLYFKDKDNPVGQTVFLRWGTIFMEGPARKSVWCKVSELKTIPEPAIITRTTTIELDAELDHNINLKLTYVFSTKGISITGKIKEPKNRNNPSGLIYAVEFKPIKSIKKEMSYQEMKSALTGYFLLTINKDGKKGKLPFWENLNPGPVREVTTVGPWGPRKVTVKTPMEKKKKTRQSNCGILSIYTGTRPHNGYRITRTALIDSKINTQIEIE
jgi:hypothetical protein